MKKTEHATVRGIAADAGVDVAMVYYIFGNKEGPDDRPDGIGERLVRRFIERWDKGETFYPLLTVWRSAAEQPLARKLLHDTLAGPVAERVAAEFGVDDPVLRIEPIASVGIDDLVAWVGPTVQRYLTGPTVLGFGG